jgi:hypothetical protein
MLQKISNAISMRASLLFLGNSHGVSSNWLHKKLSFIHENTEALVQSGSNNWPISVKDIREGESKYNEIVNLFSNKIYGSSYDCESGLASFLYAYILKVRPKVIVETGVANGITTNIIMSALEQTGGKLHSFDIDKKCLNVYTGEGKWVFHHLTKPFSSRLENEVTKIEDIELWIHDSNHGYSWQKFEYDLAFEKLGQGGMLVSDDIDASPAFGITAGKNWARSAGIFDKRKFFGFCQKTNS